ncbi:MAG TPA: YkgJ family cysteine cluster protein [Syntrophorhabdales bacterium]|nr:YkgJ family cysteine cluster protein [Syntrophorhabdales bacterium]
MTAEEKLDDRSSTQLHKGDRIRFRCHSQLACFTKCCRDVNIFLSPYDILRLKKRLAISSEDFLEKYTISLIPEASGFPVILLKMEEDRNRVCPFVASQGCSVYEDRPWSCRMFPLDQGSRVGDFHLIAPPSLCLGLRERTEQTVEQYLGSQDLGSYEENEKLLGNIASNPRFSRTSIQNPKVQEMIRMALYDLDRFRRFVLESRFLQIFHVEKEISEKIATDDVELLKLALRWLEFGLIAGETLEMREDIVARSKESSGQG